MEYIFNETPDLGGVVSRVTPFCKLMSNMPVPSYDYVVGNFMQSAKFPGLAGNKWSCLCGFTFVSRVVKSPRDIFQIVFVPKLRNNMPKDSQRSKHGWYVWQFVNSTERIVTSIEDLLKKYKFDANKFFFSDLFDKFAEQFRSNINYAVNNQLMKMIEGKPKSEASLDVKRVINAIKQSMENFLDIKNFVKDDWQTTDFGYNFNDIKSADSSEEGAHVQTAYNANLTYDLKNHDTALQAILDLERQQMKDELMKARERANASKAKDDAKPDDFDAPKLDRIEFDPDIEDKTEIDNEHDEDFGLDKYDDYDEDNY